MSIKISIMAVNIPVQPPWTGQRIVTVLNRYRLMSMLILPESRPATVHQQLVPVRTVSDDSGQNTGRNILHTARANQRLLHI